MIKSQLHCYISIRTISTYSSLRQPASTLRHMRSWKHIFFSWHHLLSISRFCLSATFQDHQSQYISTWLLREQHSVYGHLIQIQLSFLYFVSFIFRTSMLVLHWIWWLLSIFLGMNLLSLFRLLFCCLTSTLLELCMEIEPQCLCTFYLASLPIPSHTILQ